MADQNQLSPSKNILLHQLVRSAFARLHPDPPRKTQAQVQSWEYHRDVYVRSGVVISDFYRLGRIQNLIEKIPSAHLCGRWKMNQFAWVEHQSMDYAVTFDGVQDHCLLLVNDAMQIGLDPRDCKEQTILRHLSVRGTPVVGALKKLAKVCAPHRETRNLWLHRGEKRPLHEIFKSEKLFELDVFYAAKTMGRSPVRAPKLLKDLRIEARKISMSFGKEADQLESCANLLFDSLLPAYLAYTKAYDRSAGA